MSSSSARAGFREATGIRRAPPRGSLAAFRTRLRLVQAGTNWTEGADGTEGPILGNRRFPYGPPEGEAPKTS